MGLKKEVERQIKKIKAHTVEVIPLDELEKKIYKSLREEKPLKVKLGVDPTAPDLHLGHSVVLRKLRDFQELGHQVILLIGDYTGLVGDPSGRKSVRPVLTEEEIRENAKTYTSQAFKILDPDKTTIDYNSRWFKGMLFKDVLNLCGKFTVARLLERDDFNKRMEKELPIYLHELLYPVMQAYDSVALKADVELGGTDQKFNLLTARDLQIVFQQEPQIVITMPLLEGTDGTRKMSKSYGNYIGITEPPAEMFGKIMSIPDEFISRYYDLVLFYPSEKVKNIREELEKGTRHPAKVKRELAERIIEFYYSEKDAKKARKEFDRVFKHQELPSDIPDFKVTEDIYNQSGKIWIVRLLKKAELVSSNSEARRLISQGGVKLDGKVIEDDNFEWVPDNGQVVRVGKRRFIKLVVNR